MPLELKPVDLAGLRNIAAQSRESLEKIGDGDWTPQDSAHARLVQIVETFVAWAERGMKDDA